MLLHYLVKHQCQQNKPLFWPTLYMSVCPIAYLKNHMTKLCQIYCARFISSWHDLVPTTVQQTMYFWFRGWRYVSTRQRTHEKEAGLYSDVISMPAVFRRHLVGKTLLNVFHCDLAKIRFVGKLEIIRTFSSTDWIIVLFKWHDKSAPINSTDCRVIPTKWRSYRGHRCCDVIFTLCNAQSDSKRGTAPGAKIWCQWRSGFFREADECVANPNASWYRRVASAHCCTSLRCVGEAVGCSDCIMTVRVIALQVDAVA